MGQCLITRKGGVDKNYIFVNGIKYNFKTGNKGTTVTDGIIPLTLYFSGSVGVDLNTGGELKINDDKGKIYLNYSAGGGTHPAQKGSLTSYISVIEKVGFNYAQNIKSFAVSNSHTSGSVYICAWLEKVS